MGWGNARLQIPTTLPQPIRGLMGACMESDPQKRPDFEQIIVALRTIRSSMPAPSQAPPQVILLILGTFAHPLTASLSASLPFILIAMM